MNVYQYSSTATTAEDSEDVGLVQLEALCNDGSADITFGLDAPTTGTQVRTVKPGEIYSPDYIIMVRVVYFKSSSGSQAFRFWGLK